MVAAAITIFLAVAIEVAVMMMMMMTATMPMLAAARSCVATRLISDSQVTPYNPGIPSLSSISPSSYGAYAAAGCSEVVTVFRMGAGVPSWPRTNCPHLNPSLTPFESYFPSVATTGAVLTIPAGVHLLYTTCSLPNPAIVIQQIFIQSGASLVFDDNDGLQLNVMELQVAVGGALSIGSETCRLYGRINITFYGSRATSSTTLFDPTTPTKGLESQGTVDVHGKQYHPTWTRASRNMPAGSTVIFLQDAVNWEVGQQVLVTTSTFYDCPPQWASTYCNSLQHQNEVMTIAALGIHPTTGEQAIQFTAPLQYQHYSDTNYQIEVALLTRRILFSGSDSGDQFGGHTVNAFTAIARYSGVQGNKMGQLNVLARYPFHLHHLNATAGALSYFQDCSVTNSFFRCYTVHFTNSSRLSRNVAFNASGMCYYLEDGVEENNLLEYNFGAYVNPIGTPANGGYGQTASNQVFDPVNLINPADTSASVFYILDAYNTFIGNAASGGWSGFAFPNVGVSTVAWDGSSPPAGLSGTGMSGGVFDAAGTPLYWNCPACRPTLLFQGNSAHSTGFYWVGQGAAIYCGAWLWYDQTNSGKLTYNSGRFARGTINNTNGEQAFMTFLDTKVFLTYKGVAHWGDAIELQRLEAHDVWTGAMLFGQAGIYQGLINGYTANPINSCAFPICNWQCKTIRCSKEGFQFYDTFVETVLVQVTFRNFNGTSHTLALDGVTDIGNDAAVRYMDHSDEFLNQGINAVRGILFENVPAKNTVVIRQCGCECGDCTYSSMSSRLYTVLDYDGTLSQTKIGTPAILSGNRAWFNIDSSTCEKNASTSLWRCDWNSNRQNVYINVGVPGLYDGCDTTVGLCDRTTYEYGSNGQQAQYTVGYMSQWAVSAFDNTTSASRGIALSPWAGITGEGETGWYWRTVTQGLLQPGVMYNGAPSQFWITDTQLPRGRFIVLAVKYPPGTQFTVSLYHWGTFHSYAPQAASLSVVTTATETLNPASQFICAPWPAPYDVRCNNTGGVGPTWFFDGTYFYLRVVPFACYINNPDTCGDAYTYQGLNVWSVTNEISWNITAVCNGCAVQSSIVNKYSPMVNDNVNIKFYTTADVIVPTAFPSSWGAAAATTAVTYLSSNTAATCPAAPTAAPTYCTTLPSSLPASAGTGGCEVPSAVGVTCQPSCPVGTNSTLSTTTCQNNGAWSVVTGACLSGSGASPGLSHSASHHSHKPASRSVSHHSHAPPTRSASHHSHKPASRSVSHHSHAPPTRSASHHSHKQASHSVSHHSPRQHSLSASHRSKSHAKTQSASQSKISCLSAPTLAHADFTSCTIPTKSGQVCNSGVCASGYIGSVSATCTVAGKWTISGSCVAPTASRSASHHSHSHAHSHSHSKKKKKTNQPAGISTHATTTMVGAIVGSAVGVVIVAALGYTIMRRRRESQTSKTDNPMYVI